MTPGPSAVEAALDEALARIEVEELRATESHSTNTAQVGATQSVMEDGALSVLQTVAGTASSIRIYANEPRVWATYSADAENCKLGLFLDGRLQAQTVVEITQTRHRFTSPSLTNWWCFLVDIGWHDLELRARALSEEGGTIFKSKLTVTGDDPIGGIP